VALTTYQWSKLGPLQVGRYAEYFVKLELTLQGFQVYTSEVDDRGIDFVIRRNGGPFYEVQVKSVREKGYVFLPKEQYPIKPERLLAFVLFQEDKEPAAFLIPLTVWLTPAGPFVSREYKGMKSKPEWGMNVNGKQMPLLKGYLLRDMAPKL
jgi:hypothetical protein